jgi:sterol desaturase/sphingolipid hydroxylase (fatty acid hydroxylase superfamily)
LRLQQKQLPTWLSAAIVIGSTVAIFWLEKRRPLQCSTDSKVSRNLRNGLIGITAAAAMQLAEVPISRRMSEAVVRRRWGLVQRLRLPVWIETILALALLDYTLYAWHVLTHRVPFLWRFHLPHHADVDLDASTGLRFHFGEIVLGAPYRAAQILLIGVSPLTLSIWQTAMLVSIAFHHSNIELASNLERKLVCLVVTPRMHGIHHSIIPEEANSNWSSGLSIWDRLHKTMRLNVSQEDITIGVPAYRESPSFVESLAMPFVPQVPEWRLPDDGVPARPRSERFPTLLLP